MRFLLLLLLGLLLLTCGDGGAEGPQSISRTEESSDRVAEVALPEGQRMAGNREEVEMDLPRTAEAPPPPDQYSQLRNQRIIYTAAVRAEVPSLDTALLHINRLVISSGGFLASQHRSNTPFQLEAELVLRLPADGLQPLLDALPQLTERIDYQNLDSRNVTEEWLDLESRLKIKREVRDRYIGILRNRAQKVEDILNAEEKIRKVTEEIEAQEGRLRYLRDRVSLSTLNLTLYETQAYRDTGEAYERGFWSRTGSAFMFGWELVQGLAIGLIGVWPVVLLLAVLVLLWRRRRADSIL